MPLPPKLQQTLDDLAFYPDRADRIQFLIDLADQFRPADPSVFTKPHPDQNRVPGCESEVYVYTTLTPQNTLQINIAVENPQGMSAMAMAAVLQDALDDQPPALAQDIPEDVVYDLFGRELSMGKSMGLTNMVRLIKTQAKTLTP